MIFVILSRNCEGGSSMKNENALENTSEGKSTSASQVVSTTPAPAAPGTTQSVESSVAKTLRILGNTETVMGRPRQIIDAGLIGMCIAFLISLLGMQQKAIDAHLNTAVIAFGIALPLLGWGYLQAALKPKPVPGWLVLQAIFLQGFTAMRSSRIRNATRGYSCPSPKTKLVRSLSVLE